MTFTVGHIKWNPTCCFLQCELAGPCGWGDLEQIQSAFKTDASTFQTVSSKVNFCQPGFSFWVKSSHIFLCHKKKNYNLEIFPPHRQFTVMSAEHFSWFCSWGIAFFLLFFFGLWEQKLCWNALCFCSRPHNCFSAQLSNKANKIMRLREPSNQFLQSLMTR